MRSRRQQRRKELSRSIRRERRRLGRFVAFAEMQADLRPIGLIDHRKAKPALPQSKEAQIRALPEQGVR